MTFAPRVTVGVPVYNGERYLSAALESLVSQDYEDMEILISDNASTDATEEICRDFCDRDKRVVYHRNATNVGGAHNLNLLVERAQGSLFKWAYYDDVCKPTLISRSVAALDCAGAGAVLSYARVQIINDAGEPVGEHDDAALGLDDPQPAVRLANLLSKVVAQVQFGLVRTDVLRQTSGASAEIGGEFVNPVELCLRGTFELVDEQLLQLRHHNGQHGGNRETELRWIDPSGKKRTLMPYSRSSTLLLSAIRNAPLTSAQRRQCVAALLRHWTLPQWRYLAGDIRYLPQDLLHNWK